MAAYGDQLQLLKLALSKKSKIFFYLALRAWRVNIFSMSAHKADNLLVANKLGSISACDQFAGGFHLGGI